MCVVCVCVRVCLCIFHIFLWIIFFLRYFFFFIYFCFFYFIYLYFLFAFFLSCYFSVTLKSAALCFFLFSCFFCCFTALLCRFSLALFRFYTFYVLSVVYSCVLYAALYQSMCICINISSSIRLQVSYKCKRVCCTRDDILLI